MDEPESLRARIEAHLARASGAAAEVRRLERMPGGACQENWLVEVALGGAERRLVLRSDARTSIPGSHDRRGEFRLIGAAVEAGVRTPAARWLERGLVREGGWAYFLDWARGDAIGRKVVGDPRLAAARERLPDELAAELAKIHSLTPARAPDLLQGTPWAAPPADPARATLGFLRGMLDGIDEPRPALELALAWLDEHAPPPGEVTLAHGDFRTGNFMVTPEGLSAILDWEFARWSTPAEDLAWISVRDWRFGRLDLPVGGFARREPFYRAYERESGRAVRPEEVHWWEVLGNARWAAGSLHQGARWLAGDDDLELVAIARRAVEMEWEALRLIEKGPA
jgi:aminoglycoside phosphotransferase (APT) family kinase protein